MRWIVQGERGVLREPLRVLLVLRRVVGMFAAGDLFGNIGGERRKIFEMEDTAPRVGNGVSREIRPVLTALRNHARVIFQQWRFRGIKLALSPKRAGAHPAEKYDLVLVRSCKWELLVIELS